MKNVPIYVFCVLLLMFLINACVNKLIYPAPRTSVPEKPPAPLELKHIGPVDGHEVTSWILKREPDSDSVPVILYFHGNGENLETMRLAGMFERFSALKAHVISMDYPGYGNSSGKPSEASIERAANALLSWISREFPANPKFVCGWSLGAAVAIKTAAKHPDGIEGLIAISPWTSLRDCAAEHYPRFLVNLFIREEYNSSAAAKKVKSPSIVLHGSRDRTIPVRHGKTVSDSLSGAAGLKSFPVSGHNDLLDNPEVWKEISAFIHER